MTPRTVRAKVTGQVLTLDDTLQETLPAVLACWKRCRPDSPFLQLDPPQRRQRTLEALKRLLLRESQVQPLLLVFEDLHWIDAETQALLDSLVESLPTARLLLLVNYRPEYQHGWGSKTYYTPTPARPAATRERRGIPAGPPGGRPEPGAAHTAPDCAHGGQSLLSGGERAHPGGDRGARRRREGPIAWRRPLEHLQVPATVQAVLAARIDRLPPEEKRLLQTAAVIGTEVPLALLQAIAELPEEALHRGLTHLQAAEFLYETRLFPEHAYTFKHALTHEVAYGSLLHERRRVLHARIVEALEALAPDRVAEQVERLAHHALRGEVWERPWRTAGRRGTRPWRGPPTARPWSPSSRRSAPSRICQTRVPRASRRIDLRLALRTALSRPALWAYPGRICARPSPSPQTLDDPRRLGRSPS